MKKISFVAILLFVCTFSTFAQTTGHTTPGSVWRVTYVRILPGKANDFLMELRRNTRPVFEEYKKAGLISDYKIYANSTNDSPGDWDYALVLCYKNWAAIDDFAPKAAAIRLKHYGSAEKEQEAQTKRTQLGETVASKLMREVTLNPLP